MIFRPDIKPPMWGPPDAVAYAVRVNAERMGIPAPLGVWPLWEGAGAPINQMSGEVGVLVGATAPAWAIGTDGLELRWQANNTGFMYQTAHQGMTYASPDRWSVFGRACPLPGSSSQNVICSPGYTATNYWHGLSLQYSPNPRAKFDVDAYASALTDTVAAGSEELVSAAGANYSNTSRKAWLASLSGQGSATSAATATSRALITRVGLGVLADSNPDGGQVRIGLAYFWPTWAMDDAHFAALNATPYALLMPVSRPVYFDLGGGGSTTHEAALTLSSAGALAPGASADFSASLALTAEGGLSDASAAEYSAAWQAAAQAALVPGGAAVLFAGLALSGSGSLSASATASYAATLGLPVSAGLAPSYGSIVTAALALEAVGAMTPTARADYQATLAALAQAGMSAAAAAQLAASWQATVVAALLSSTTGLAIDAGLALPCAAALTATGYAELAAALSLSTGASIDPAALQTAFAGLEFSVLAALAATHPDDVATVMRVLVLFRGASPGVDLSGKSPSITIQ